MQIGSFLEVVTFVSAILTILLILLQQRGASLGAGFGSSGTAGAVQKDRRIFLWNKGLDIFDIGNIKIMGPGDMLFLIFLLHSQSAVLGLAGIGIHGIDLLLAVFNDFEDRLPQEFLHNNDQGDSIGQSKQSGPRVYTQ